MKRVFIRRILKKNVQSHFLGFYWRTVRLCGTCPDTLWVRCEKSERSRGRRRKSSGRGWGTTTATTTEDPPRQHVLCAAQKHHQTSDAARWCRPHEFAGSGGNQGVSQGKFIIWLFLTVINEAAKALPTGLSNGTKKPYPQPQPHDPYPTTIQSNTLHPQTPIPLPP